MKTKWHEAFGGQDFDKQIRPQLEGKTWAEIFEQYEQPEWCTYPEAISGMMGCWSLVYGHISGENQCLECECHKKN